MFIYALVWLGMITAVQMFGLQWEKEDVCAIISSQVVNNWIVKGKILGHGKPKLTAFIIIVSSSNHILGNNKFLEVLSSVFI